MIVDTSALVTILSGEPEASRFLERLLEAERSRLSAGSWIELSAVVTRSLHDQRDVDLQKLLARLGISIVPMSVEQAQIGHEAYRRYGRGTGHPARLNFGDCFAYALAKENGEPLLFKGDDFSQTDVTPAL